MSLSGGFREKSITYGKLAVGNSTRSIIAVQMLKNGRFLAFLSKN